MKKYDVVVIGAGNGGLACANVLAKNGKKVLVLEQSHVPGGFATSFKRGRFEFEVSLHELCTFGRYDKPFGSVRQLFDYLEISDKIEWVDIPEAFRLINFKPGCEFDVTMPFGIDAFCKTADRHVPGCEKAMQHLFQLNEEIRWDIESYGKARSKMAQMYALFKKGRFVHTAPYSVDEVLSKLKLSEDAKKIIKAYWVYLCVDCETIGFFHYMSMVNAYIELGAVVPALRSQEMTNCLVECMTENGAELWLNSKVVKIDVSNNRCGNVILEDGTQVQATDVVCGISPHIAYGKLIDYDKIPEFELRKTNAREFGGRGFCVFLGLNKSVKELGLNEYSYFICPDMDTKTQYEKMKRPETNEVQNSVCLNAANPSASPEGTCILCLTTLFTSDYWSGVAEQDYFREKEAFALKMIETFEKATKINIKGYIEEIEIASPETFARFTGAPQGTIYGYHPQDWDGTLQRTMVSGREKGIENLYFVGGYGDKLLGYSSAFSSGRDCARRICQKSRDIGGGTK